jgi:hypothetical protein
MSKEMKERLRREYYGLGGSPNQVGATAVADTQWPMPSSQLHVAWLSRCVSNLVCAG